MEHSDPTERTPPAASPTASPAPPHRDRQPVDRVDDLAGQQLVETRNGSGNVLKQQVWGLSYIDELVQTSLNHDPTDTTEDDCEFDYYALQDAHFNLLGMYGLDETGREALFDYFPMAGPENWVVADVFSQYGKLVERYEYTPYGERTVYFSAGGNDPDAMSPTGMSRRWTAGAATEYDWTLDSTAQPYGLNDIGHQGLMHDEETGLIENRRRMRSPRLERWLQREPLGYIDGMSLYPHVRSNPILYVDPTGLQAQNNSKHGQAKLMFELGGGEYQDVVDGKNSSDELVAMTEGLRAGATEAGKQAAIEAGTAMATAGTGGPARRCKPMGEWLICKVCEAGRWVWRKIRKLGPGAKAAPTPPASALPGPNAGTRYVGPGEAEVIEQTGQVPNTDIAGKQKNVFYTHDAPIDSASGAQDAYQLPVRPTHRVEVDTTNANPVYGGNVDGGNGSELITNNTLPAGKPIPMDD